MRHLDEGQLQAWLDGPRAGLSDEEREAVARHLDGCAECARRLEALEGESARAAALLGTPVPGGAPAFHDIVARAESVRTPPAPVRPVRRWRAVGWAASILVAAGAGWMANDLFRRDPMAVPRPSSVRTDEAPAPTLESAAILEEAAAGAAGAAPPPPAPITAPVTDPTTAPITAPTPAPPDREIAAVEAPRARAAAEAARRDDLQEARPAGPSTIVGQVLDAASGRPLESAQVYVPELDAGALTGTDGRFVLALDPARGAVAPDSLTLSVELIGYGAQRRPLPIPSGDTVVPDFRLESRALALDELVVTGVAADARGLPVSLDAVAWTPATEAEAAAALGAPPARIDGLEVVAVETALVDGQPLVRLIQTLDDGGRLTLVQAAVPVDLIDLPQGWAVATTRHEGRWIAATAPRTEARLRELLARLR